ncbi:hypothetical protein CDL12_23694 [Handroanthus impetiginosus]|uniref:Rapid ALkalinization Factor n=1 Tax=Handroanthus impetiginosus TaxID=429701 RepID=A0A2G9GEQ6_9LAMI|nr:hypothetical protein CDL12_23694 [Handroanthus impetiginosus]
MAFRVVLVLLMVALATMATAASAKEHAIHFGLRPQVDGHGLVADALELDEELLMESESARRQLGQAGGYISYGALNRNNVPCNRRGQSYYNCNSHQKANPYSRGCTRVTNCARNNH